MYVQFLQVSYTSRATNSVCANKMFSIDNTSGQTGAYIHVYMESSSATTTITLVTLSATYVCTPQFQVISRQPHIDTEQDDQDGSSSWIIPEMEVGPNKPEQIVMCMNR